LYLVMFNCMDIDYRAYNFMFVGCFDISPMLIFIHDTSSISKLKMNIGH
jgi:hypothetical protein